MCMIKHLQKTILATTTLLLCGATTSTYAGHLSYFVDVLK